MVRPVLSQPRLAPPGGALGFVAARRRRRQESGAAPQLSWAGRDFASTRGEADGSMPSAAWVLTLENAGGAASEARVVLFTNGGVTRGLVGEVGHIDASSRWELVLEQASARPDSPPLGYVLARGSDRRWHATTVDGRAASFRTEPDEVGVLRTLGLRDATQLADAPGLVHSHLLADVDADATLAH